MVAQLARQSELGADPQPPAAGPEGLFSDAEMDGARPLADGCTPHRAAVGGELYRMVGEEAADPHPEKHVEEQAVARRQRNDDVAAGVASPSAPVFRVGPEPVRSDLLPPQKILLLQQFAQKQPAPRAFDSGQHDLAGAVDVAVQLAEVYFARIGNGRVRVRLLPNDPGGALAGSHHALLHRMPRDRLVAASYFRFQSAPRRVVAQQSADDRQRAVAVVDVDVRAKFAGNLG